MEEPATIETHLIYYEMIITLLFNDLCKRIEKKHNHTQSSLRWITEIRWTREDMYENMHFLFFPFAHYNDDDQCTSDKNDSTRVQSAHVFWIIEIWTNIFFFLKKKFDWKIIRK